MRLKRNKVKTFYLRKRIVKKDEEGSTYTEYEDAKILHGEIWQAGGKIQAEMYGDRLPYVQNVRIEGRYTIKSDEKGVQHYMLENGADLVENDGICIYTMADQPPDYRIISIKPHRFLRLEVERICQ